MARVEIDMSADQCSELSTTYADWDAAVPAFADGVLSVEQEHEAAIRAHIAPAKTEAPKK